jgi:tetratricopeptide (TPR) repeat protein
LFHLYRGSELLQDNFIAEAKEELERALSLQPRDVEGQALLGIVYFRLGLYPRAIQIYEDIIQVRPREATPLVNLALCYLKTGQIARARDMLERAIAMAPDHNRAWGYLGLVFERLGEFSNAQAAFERAGQSNMAQRMRLLTERATENESGLGVAERDQVRHAAAEAVRELDAVASEPPFARAESEQASPSRSGRWAAIEPGQLLPPREHRVPSGDDVPPLSLTAPPAEETEAGGSVFVSAPRSARASSEAIDRAFPEAPGAILAGCGLVLVRFEGSFAARQRSLRLLLPDRDQLKSSVVARRNRGRDLEQPMGDPAAPIVLCEGSGRLAIAAEAGRSAVVIDLLGDFLYVSESRVLGFAGSLQHENGRLVGGGGEQIPIVQLSGHGALIVECNQPLVRMTADIDRPIVVHAADVVAWRGRLLATPLAPDATPGGVHGFVEISGDGSVYFSFGEMAR